MNSWSTLILRRKNQMLVSTLFVQHVPVHIWKVKNAFDVSRTYNMSILESLMGESIYYTNPRSWRVALLSNGVAEREAEGSHCNVADETS